MKQTHQNKADSEQKWNQDIEIAAPIINIAPKKNEHKPQKKTLTWDDDKGDDSYTNTQQELIQQQQQLFKQYQSNLIAKKQQMEKQRKNHTNSQSYNKALFTLSYLVSLQLRKYMEIFNQFAKMRIQDITDIDIMKQKQE